MVRLLAQAKRKYEWVWNKDQRLREYREKEKAIYRAKYNDSAFRTKERARQQRYRHTNPDKVAEWMDKRRKLVAQVNDGTVGDNYAELMNEYRVCPYCSVELTSSNKSLDHMEPISKGGIHSSSNIIVCCSTCNGKKHNKDFTTWIDSLPAFNRNVSTRAWEAKKNAAVGQMGLRLNF